MACLGALTVTQCLRYLHAHGEEVRMSVLARDTCCLMRVNDPILEDIDHSTVKGLIKTLINQLNQIYEQELPLR